MCGICDNCYLSLRNTKTAGRGVGCTPALTPTILFIGDCPSQLDSKNQKPFSGRKSKLLTEFIDTYKLGSWSYATNIIQCVCPEPTIHYAENCYPHLIKTIRNLKPVLIVAVGHFAYRFLKDDNTRNMKYVVNKLTTFNTLASLTLFLI